MYGIFKLRFWPALLLACVLLYLPAYAAGDSESGLLDPAPLVEAPVEAPVEIPVEIPVEVDPVDPSSVVDVDSPADGGSAVDSGSASVITTPVVSSVTCSGSVVSVDVVDHDTLAVPSVSAVLYAADGDTDTPSLSKLLEDLLGPYRPHTQLVTTYYDGQLVSVDEQVIPGLAGLDWEWLASAGLFIMSLYCVFRLVGGILKWS